MGKVLGIVAEYNPFHNGHLYHLEKAKKDTNSDYTIAVISGNFSQRGNSSLVDKWSKSKMALLNGVDLVIELPVLYSISSAENFAEGAIKILDSLKIVDYVSFGCETDDINILDKFADILYNEPEEFKNILLSELDKGISYPKARENALMMYLNDSENFKNVLSSPNNILGIEYIKALKKLKSDIQPFPIQRVESKYNDINYTGNIASATAIRDIVKNDNLYVLENLLPDESYSILMENIRNGHVVPDLSVFEKEIIYTLRKMDISEIAELPDVSEGLEFAIKNAVNSCNNIAELLDIVKSKRYTQTRLQRILLYALLGITKKDMLVSKSISPYIRILGFNKNGKYLISEISKTNPNLEIVTSVKRFTDSNSNDDLQVLFDKDVLATNIYTLGFKNNSFSNLDFTNKITSV